MEYRIEYANGNCRNYANNRKDLLEWLSILKESVVSIIVRNQKEKLISKTGFISVAVSGERLYFKEETEQVGYKDQ